MRSPSRILGPSEAIGGANQPELRSERVARLLCEQISHHDLQPGDRLPSENALATHFGVSRPVIREAIAMLKADGLLETFQGSGAYIRRRIRP